MKLEYILTFWLMLITITIVIFGSEKISKDTLGHSIKVVYNNGSLEFYHNDDIIIYSLTIFPDNKVYNDTRIELDRCPRAVVLDTNKGYYKIFDLKC